MKLRAAVLKQVDDRTLSESDWFLACLAAGKLNLVDLAGSERIAKSGAEGSRLREAQCINKSLSALGDVINALRSKHSHVPFRNSRLTYLLQDSLSGDSKTLMMVQVRPGAGLKERAAAPAGLRPPQRVFIIVPAGRFSFQFNSSLTETHRWTVTAQVVSGVR